jgi:outer membrane protein assembly factor BamB
VVALDANTGSERWRVNRDERTTWATPLVVEHDGRTQLVMNGSNRVRSYDLADGELIWECGGQAANPIPSPLTTNGLVYCMTGYKGFAVYAIPLNATGDISDSDVIPWHRTDSGPYVSSPVLYKGVIYHSKDRKPIVSSLDAVTGKPRINQKRLDDIRAIYASPVAAADRVYFTGRGGTTVVISHSDKLEVLATNKLDEGIDASPALVGNELYLRGEKHLYCIAEN